MDKAGFLNKPDVVEEILSTIEHVRSYKQPESLTGASNVDKALVLSALDKLLQRGLLNDEGIHQLRLSEERMK